TAPPPPPSTSTSTSASTTTTTTIITNITQDPTIPNVPQAYQARAAWLNKERLAVQHFAVASKKAKGIPDLTSTMHAVQLERTVQLVNFLEHAFAISPEYRRDTQIDVALRLMFAHDEFHFPADLKRRAEALVRGWEEAHWGDVVPAVDGEDDDDGDDGDGGQASTTLPTGSTAITTTTAAVITTTTAAAITTAATTTATTNTAATTTAITATATATATAPAAAPAAARIILRPPPDHPIWGVNGIMHGVMVSMHGQKKDKMLDDRYQRRDADVLGANGLVAGQWWPNQMAALFWGAHGHSQAGVFGSVKYGAISIVVAGTYKDLDDE
ncbi:E3 ubiquitin-protein ligase ORTHRUS 2, partial [Cytospora mali]